VCLSEEFHHTEVSLEDGECLCGDLLWFGERHLLVSNMEMLAKAASHNTSLASIDWASKPGKHYYYETPFLKALGNLSNLKKLTIPPSSTRAETEEDKDVEFCGPEFDFSDVVQLVTEQLEDLESSDEDPSHLWNIEIFWGAIIYYISL
jgi:hypothetical protein